MSYVILYSSIVISIADLQLFDLDLDLTILPIKIF
jgi:hypothetical protein